MKKILLIAAIAVFGITSVQAQEGGVKVGLTVALPMGDAGDFSTFGAGLDVAYLANVADSFLVGAATGYQHFFGKTETIAGFEIEFDDVQFIPIAAAARFDLDGLFFGADLGYALGVNDGNDGGFYYRPKAGYSFGNISLLASYIGVSLDGGSWTSVGLGVEFGF